MQQQTITTYGPLADHIQRLAEEYPGITPHRVGRALLTLAIRQVEATPSLLAGELRALTSRREEGQSGA